MDARQYPRVGKIKIGEPKKPNAPGRGIDYFRPTGRYAAIFTEILGEKPNEIEIVFPPAPNGDIDQVINHYYRSYKGSKLFCIGDGETAKRSDGKGNMVERKCPCELLNDDKKHCSERLRLAFIIPKIPIVGVWEFETGGIHTRINAFSGIDITKAFAGNVAGIPMTMRVEFQTGAIAGSQSKFPVVSIVPNASTEQLLQLQNSDVNTRLNVMLMGQPMPKISEEPEPKRITASERQHNIAETIMTDPSAGELLTEEPEPEDLSVTDLNNGELSQAISAELNDMSPMKRRDLKIEHLGTESISDCENIDKKVKFLQFLQKKE